MDNAVFLDVTLSTDASKERTASIIMVERLGELGTLAVTVTSC
jgi:hypothetical protein